MKIAPMFSLKLNFFDFTSLRQGQFLANYGKIRKIKAKRFKQGYTKGTFSLT